MSSRFVRYAGSLVIFVGAALLYLTSLANGPDRDLHFSRDVPSAATLTTLSPELEDIRNWPHWFHSLAQAQFADLNAPAPESAQSANSAPPLAEAAGLGELAPPPANRGTTNAAGVSAGANGLAKLPTVDPAARQAAITQTGGYAPKEQSPRTQVKATAAKAAQNGSDHFSRAPGTATLRPEIPANARISAGREIRLWIDPMKGPWAKFELVARVMQVVPGRMIVLEIEKDSTGKLTRQFDHLEWKVELQPGRGAFPTVVHGEVEAHTAHWRSRLFGQLAKTTLMNQVYYINLFKLAEQSESQGADQTDYLRQN